MNSTLLSSRYRILRSLGRGGFGETFLAEDTHMPSGRYCVIKQLKPIDTNPQILQLVRDRFGREAAILEELSQGSRQIPTLYAYFIEAGQFYLVQEWIEGPTLGQQVSGEGRLSDAAVRTLLDRLLPVLEYVHSKRIVHRDIKPDNIIARLSDNLPVLIDFGAVREAMATQVASSGHAASSIVIGTPGFMSSEQAAGRPVYSSDLYSLGLTAIYALTGKIPQELDTDPHTGALIWRSHAPGVSAQLAAVLDKATEPSPRDRFPSASAMLAALQLQSDPPIPSPTSQQPVQPHSYPPTVPVSPPQPSYPQQSYPQQSYPQPSYPQQSYPQQSYPQQSYPKPSPPQQSYPTQPAPESHRPVKRSGGVGGALLGGLIGLGTLVGIALAVNQVQTTNPEPINDPPQEAAIEPDVEPIAPPVPDTPEQPPEPTAPVADSFYFLADSAYKDKDRASQKVQQLQSTGFPQAGSFWIPDYPNLSGQRYTQVYAAQFSDRESCVQQLAIYAKSQSDAYCALASTDPHISDERIEAKELDKDGSKEVTKNFPNIRFPFPGQNKPDDQPSETPNNKPEDKPEDKPNDTSSTTPSERPAPEQTIRQYYDYLNQKQYRSSWDLFSDALKQDSRLHPQGFSTYEEFWNDIDRVNVQEVTPLEIKGDEARVLARTSLQMKDGTVSPISLRIKLVWDEKSGRWLYDDAKIL
jgi:serine/threonine protein kinase, bacterial